MPVSEWHLVPIAVVLAVNLLLTYHLFRLQRRDDAGMAAPGEDPVDPGDDYVDCPDCGTENEVGYRFCRSCLAELPGTMKFMRESADPLGGMTR